MQYKCFMPLSEYSDSGRFLLDGSGESIYKSDCIIKYPVKSLRLLCIVNRKSFKNYKKIKAINIPDNAYNNNATIREHSLYSDDYIKRKRAAELLEIDINDIITKCII